ncbi:MAG TPA: hypothetical protein VF607_10620, partial [Verrucomicrobiae bacterium]
MTNNASAIRMLVTYAVCILLAAVMGRVMVDVGNNPDYSNLFMVGLVLLVLAFPIIVKWHYPLMVASLSAPIFCFFLKGYPPLWQVMVILSFF